MKNYLETAVTEFMTDNLLKDEEEFKFKNCDNTIFRFRVYQFHHLQTLTVDKHWVDNNDSLIIILSGETVIEKLQPKIQLTQDEYDFLRLAKNNGYHWICRSNSNDFSCVIWTKVPTDFTEYGDYFATDGISTDVMPTLFENLLKTRNCFNIDKILDNYKLKEE